MCFRHLCQNESIIIEKITDDRQINPLYHSLSWYLMNQVNLDEEEIVKYSIESKISETSEKKPDLFILLVFNIIYIFDVIII